MMDNMYREYLIEHYKNPKNKGIIKNAQIISKESNPMCGDEVSVYVQVSKNGLVNDIKFVGSGCVISMASASILSEYIVGKNIDDVDKIDRDEMLSLLDLKLTPTRVKCAMLALSTIKKGILEYKSRGKK